MCCKTTFRLGPANRAAVPASLAIRPTAATSLSFSRKWTRTPSFRSQPTKCPNPPRRPEMSSKRLQSVERRLTDAQRQRHAQVRAAAERDFSPKSPNRRPAAPGIGAAIRAAREAQGLTWYALAQRAHVPNQATIRDIEQGKDVKLSNLRA